MTSPVLDREHLARYTAGDAQLEAELFALLDQQIDSCVARLERTRDSRTWLEASHTLKGAAFGIGAMALGEACAALERARPDTALLEPLRQVAERTRAAMRAA
ncbi:MAG: Hpt domain-containing protein [Pseudomonadota bacterium]